MDIVKFLKLYRLKTIYNYCIDSWENTTFVVDQINKGEYTTSQNRLQIWFDLVYWYLLYGYDFNDYCTFKFWLKDSTERKSYISYRRNITLFRFFSTPRVYNLFLDKAAFNERFAKYVKRGWMTMGGVILD